jgi:hypothetical protein
MMNKENSRLVFQADKPSGGSSGLEKFRKLKPGVEEEIGKIADEYAKKVESREMTLNQALVEGIYDFMIASLFEEEEEDK